MRWRNIYDDSQITNKVAKQETGKTQHRVTKQEEPLQGEDFTFFYGTAEMTVGDEVAAVDGLMFIEDEMPSPEAFTCSSPKVIRATCRDNESFPTWGSRGPWLLLLAMFPGTCTGRLASFGV